MFSQQIADESQAVLNDHATFHLSFFFGNGKQLLKATIEGDDVLNSRIVIGQGF
jgi:hypothetical protein